MFMQLPRERVPYTPEEEHYIVQGVQKLGHRWRHILSAYPFHPHRTPVDIKDKLIQTTESKGIKTTVKLHYNNL